MMKALLFSLSLVAFVFHSNAQLCIDPEQIDSEIFCLTVVDPVCGCDGVTYNNECEAYYWYGVTSWTAGECGEQVLCLDLADMDFGDCEAILGVGMVDGECVVISGCSTVDLNTDLDMADYFYNSVLECQVACNPDACLDLAAADFGECDMVLGFAMVNGECVLLSGCSMTDMISGLDLSAYFYEDAESCQLACTAGSCIDLAGVDFGLCDFVLGVGIIDGECVGISGCDYTVNGTDYTNAFFPNLDECAAACTNLVEDISLEILSIYPIPFTDEFQVEFSTSTSGNYTLLDLSGRVVLNGTIKSSMRVKIETQSLPKGLYFFSLNSDNQLLTRKVVKE